jgi:putative DNA primase/helicase
VVLDRNGRPVPFNPTAAKVSGILDALKSGCFQNERRELPFWLARDLQTLPRTGWLACKNGLVELSPRELYDHTPLYFNTVALPYDYDPDARHQSTG